MDANENGEVIRSRGDEKSLSSPGNNENASVEGERYELTELKNVPTKPDIDPVNVGEIDLESPLEEIDAGTVEENIQRSEEDFQIRLSELVSQHPCIYDQLDPNYGQKQTAIVYKLNVWDQIAQQLDYNGDVASLQNHWKNLRSRFSKCLRKDPHDGAEIDHHPVFAHMRWLERYLMPINERVLLASSTTNTVPIQSSPRDVYYVDQQTTPTQEDMRDVMISGYQTQPVSAHTLTATSSSQPPHRIQANTTTSHSTTTSHHSDTRANGGSGFYIIRNGGSSGGALRFVSPTNNSDQANSGTPTTSRVTVVPASKSVSGAVIHLQPGQHNLHNIRPNQRVQIIAAPSSSGVTSSSQYDHRTSSVDGSITVTASGNAGTGLLNVKKDQMGTMVVDPSQFYTSGGQKMYRIVNVGEVHDQHSAVPPTRKRMILTRGVIPSPHGHQQSQQGGSVTQLMTMPAGTSRNSVGSAAVSQLSEEVIIDDGIQDRTVVIDNEVQPDSPLLSESPTLGSMMISGHQVMTPRQVGQHSRNLQGQHIVQLQPELTSNSPEEHPQYLQQSQYDADLAFQQLISTGLGRYDEDMKSIIKFHIQRILLDARFGKSFANQLVNEESEMASGTVVTSNAVTHEMVPQ